jgi:hypothetical protein
VRRPDAMQDVLQSLTLSLPARSRWQANCGSLCFTTLETGISFMRERPSIRAVTPTHEPPLLPSSRYNRIQQCLQFLPARCLFVTYASGPRLSCCRAHLGVAPEIECHRPQRHDDEIHFHQLANPAPIFLVDRTSSYRV